MCGTPLRVQAELKHVSILFADLCDSTRLIAGRTPEGAQQFLQDALDTMSSAVESFGGAITQDRGDGLVAVFGAPRAQEDHALRACLAGLKMQRDAQARSLALRVGVHSGEALVRLSGDGVRMLGSLDGRTVHLAARLEQLAAPGRVLVSQDTWRAVDDALDAVPLGPHAIRGFDQRIPLFELADPQGASAAAPMARRRRLAPLVGRDAVLALLLDAAGQARSGRLRVIGLRGEAGVGKSRLLSEFGERIQPHGAALVQARCRAYLSDSPLWALTDLAQTLARARFGQLPDAVQLAAEGPPELRGALAAVLGLPQPGDEPAPSPRLRRQRMVAAMEALARPLATLGPRTLVLEDLHLADQESQRLIDQWLARLQDLPLLVCLSYRPEYAHRWQDAAWFTEVVLEPLPADHMQRMAQALLGDHPGLDALRAALIERSDGKPFFLEQFVLGLVDDGTLVGPPGGYRLASPLAGLPAPGTVALVTASVVDRLPGHGKACLRAAAVLDSPVVPQHVERMTGLSEADVAAALRACVGAGLLRAAAPAGATPSALEFRHALVQDAVLASLTRAAAVALHRAAHAVLAEVHADDSRWAAVLARHAHDGELWEDAAALWARSISVSVLRSAHRDALRHFRLGCEAAARVTDARRRMQLEMALRLEALGAQMPLGQLDDILTNLAAAGELAAALGDHRQRASVGLQRSVLFWMRGRYDEALSESGMARQAGAAAGRRALQLAAGQVRVMTLHGLGRYREAAAEAHALVDAHAVELADPRMPPGWATLPAVNLQSFLASSMWRLDDVGAAQRACDAGYRFLQRVDHPYSRGLIDFVQAQIWLERDRAAQAEPLMAESVRQCERHDILTLYPCVAALHGAALALCDRSGDAIHLLEATLGSGVSAHGGTYGEFFLRHYLALALRCAGRWDEAEGRAAQAVRFATDGQQWGHRAQALLQQGELLAGLGRDDEALHVLGQAQAQAERCAMAYLVRATQLRVAQLHAGQALARAGRMLS